MVHMVISIKYLCGTIASLTKYALYKYHFFCLQVDVYSFGVLLCEICIRKLPNPDRRDEQVAMVTNRVLRALIRGCLHPDPQERPSMEGIIGELEKLV